MHSLVAALSRCMRRTQLIAHAMGVGVACHGLSMHHRATPASSPTALPHPQFPSRRSWSRSMRGAAWLWTCPPPCAQMPRLPWWTCRPTCRPRRPQPPRRPPLCPPAAAPATRCNTKWNAAMLACRGSGERPPGAQRPLVFLPLQRSCASHCMAGVLQCACKPGCIWSCLGLPPCCAPWALQGDRCDHRRCQPASTCLCPRGLHHLPSLAPVTSPCPAAASTSCPLRRQS